MLRRALIALAATALLTGPAQASEEKKEKAGDVGQYVDLQPVGVPVVVKGQLVNYVFVYVRLNLSSSANASKLRESEPYFRDALVRASHRTPFTLATDYNKVDEKRLTAAVLQEAAAVPGAAGQIRSCVITSQAPRRRAPAPTA